MILSPFQNKCDICGKPRTRMAKHDACSVKRKALGFSTPQVKEEERLAKGKAMQRKYLNGTYVFGD